MYLWTISPSVYKAEPAGEERCRHTVGTAESRHVYVLPLLFDSPKNAQLHNAHTRSRTCSARDPPRSEEGASARTTAQVTPLRRGRRRRAGAHSGFGSSSASSSFSVFSSTSACQRRVERCQGRVSREPWWGSSTRRDAGNGRAHPRASSTASA